MKKLLPFGTLGLAGLVGVGLLSFPTTTAAIADDLGDKAFTKRDDHAAELVLVDHDDDDDTGDQNTGTRTRTRSRDTRHSRVSHDNTRSNVTSMSRDRDHSRGDKTRDWTRDGGTHTRDWSQNHPNDHSRNDTRGRR
jgi:hypothetical protein